MVPKINEGITESDYQNFLKVISLELTSEQKKIVVSPQKSYKDQDIVLAVHWHPEFIPMSLIGERLKALYPNKECELIIPTQHNQLMNIGDYSGVEVDCYSSSFNQKIHLLIHLKNERLGKASKLIQILSQTFKYRSKQLFDIIHTITNPIESRINRAAVKVCADQELVQFTKVHVKKIEKLIERNEAIIPYEAIKNKILRDYFDTLRVQHGDTFINKVQNYLNAVKIIVKAEFPLQNFFRTSEVIEEARSLGAGIVIPHPEKFWPVILAEYDVDGYEVWNPTSYKYTEFLISYLIKKNKHLKPSQRELLLFMGDDTHMSEKIKMAKEQDSEKASREIGLQPAWEDLNIKKKLVTGNIDRKKIIKEYMSRLN